MTTPEPSDGDGGSREWSTIGIRLSNVEAQMGIQASLLQDVRAHGARTNEILDRIDRRQELVFQAETRRRGSEAKLLTSIWDAVKQPLIYLMMVAAAYAAFRLGIPPIPGVPAAAAVPTP